MYRKLEKTLETWKSQPHRKPLLIMGARQTGKTYLMESFGSSHFDSTIFIDFEKRPRAKSVFDGDLDPSVILPQLEALTGTRFIAGRTLVVLDEIQACPRAITALKYFYDSGLDIHVIGAGSLLGVAIRRDDFSFPVGKVRTVRLHPLDFEEFLIAMDETVLLEACRSAFFSSSPLPAAVHEELLSFYRTYLVTGGMPEVVSTFLDGRSFIAVQDVQAEILSNYKADNAKYDADSQKVLAQRAFETLPMQLAKENRKFQYYLIRKGATSALFGKSIEWLCSAGLALRCVKVTTPELPLNAYEDISSFKLYLLDPGLLVQMADLPKEVVLNQLAERFMGGLTENYVASTLMANDVPLHYWQSAGQAEVDFLMQVGSGIVPLEVKASDNVRSRSLSVYRGRFAPEVGIRLSTRNFSLSEGLFCVPLYAAFLLSGENVLHILGK